MHCQEAQQLFDSYLDGELPAGLATELGAHRLRCPDCRRALALLEVSGHIIASDREPVALGGDFEDRLLACVEPRLVRWRRRLRRGLYIAGPLAAAAVIVLAFLGFFDRPDAIVAGEKVTRPVRALSTQPRERRSLDPRSPQSDVRTGSAQESRLRDWVIQTQQNLAAKRESGKSLQKALDITILQMLDILEEADEKARAPDQPSATDPTAPRTSPDPSYSSSDDIEDL